jgi:phosphonatase-like hydrolase
MIMFDLSGTTVEDDTAVRDCLYRAAVEYGIASTPEEIQLFQGMNKVHLYQFLIARSQGRQIGIEDLERTIDPATLPLALEAFAAYSRYMVDHYRNEVRAMPGAVDTFRWCRAQGIKIATDTGFHRDVTEAIMDGLGWLRDGLIDISVNVEDVPNERGRPAPFMIYHAMMQLDVQSVHEVIKIGDTPADMLEGHNAGCRGVVGVLSGPRPVEAFGRYWHTHIIPSVRELPELIESQFG